MKKRQRSRWNNIKSNARELSGPLLALAGFFALPVARAASSISPGLFQTYRTANATDTYVLWMGEDSSKQTFGELKDALSSISLLEKIEMSRDAIVSATWDTLNSASKACELADIQGSVYFSSLANNSLSNAVDKLVGITFNNVTRSIEECKDSLNNRANLILVGSVFGGLTLVGALFLYLVCLRRRNANANLAFNDPFNNYALIPLEEIIIVDEHGVSHARIPPATDHKERLIRIGLDPDNPDNADKIPQVFFCLVMRSFMENPIVLDTGHTVDYTTYLRMPEKKALHNPEKFITHYAPNLFARDSIETFVVKEEAKFEKRQETEAPCRRHFSLS